MRVWLYVPDSCDVAFFFRVHEGLDPNSPLATGHVPEPLLTDAVMETFVRARSTPMTDALPRLDRRSCEALDVASTVAVEGANTNQLVVTALAAPAMPMLTALAGALV